MFEHWQDKSQHSSKPTPLKLTEILSGPMNFSTGCSLLRALRWILSYFLFLLNIRFVSRRRPGTVACWCGTSSTSTWSRACWSRTSPATTSPRAPGSDTAWRSRKMMSRLFYRYRRWAAILSSVTMCSRQALWDLIISWWIIHLDNPPPPPGSNINNICHCSVGSWSTPRSSLDDRSPNPSRSSSSARPGLWRMWRFIPPVTPTMILLSR